MTTVISRIRYGQLDNHSPLLSTFHVHQIMATANVDCIYPLLISTQNLIPDVLAMTSAFTVAQISKGLV